MKSDLDLQPANDNQPSEIWLNIWGAIKFFGSVVILVFIINAFGFQSYEVFGQSMHPTLDQGDRLIVSKIEKSFSGLINQDYIPDRGEIIVFEDPRQSGLQLIKRVVAMPGERVVLVEGVFTIYNAQNPNGLKVDEKFETDFAYTNGNVDFVVPEDHIFVVGDNRNPGGSLDSRNDLGPVPLNDVVGELVLRIFPLSKMRWF